MSDDTGKCDRPVVSIENSTKCQSSLNTGEKISNPSKGNGTIRHTFFKVLEISIVLVFIIFVWGLLAVPIVFHALNQNVSL